MYWRLSSFYLFYFGSLGALLPYWSVYLKSRGFDSLAIGELMALLMVTKVISPNVWGWIADHTGRRMAVVRLGALLATLSFGGVFFVSGYWALAGVMFLFSFFWNAALPQFEATTLTHLGRDTHRYSSIRLWGSIGFIASVMALGALLDVHGPQLLPTALLLLFSGIWLTSLMVPEQAVDHGDGNHEPLLRILRRPEVLAVLAVSFLIQASHGPYYTFYTLYMTAHGYSGSAVGRLWALGVVAEIGIFLLMSRLVPRYGLSNLLLASLGLTTLRWLLIGFFPDHLAVMLFAQTLHAASFGIFHAVAIALFHHFFAGRHHGKGQALYSSISFGAGGALGSYYSGLTWDTLGPAWSYGIAAGCSGIGFLIAWRWLRGTFRP